MPRQLPPALRDFTGRSDQLEVLDALLPGTGDVPGVVTVAAVDGTGGCGKTSLVVQWAHRVQDRFPDGVLFANLRGYGPSAALDPGVVLASFLLALGVAEARIPADVDAQAGVYRSVLADQRLLIVLDNAADAGQVRALLPGVPGSVTVVTSRANLTELVVLDAAQRVGLDLFTTAESHSLLCGILGSDRVDAEPGAAGDLVRMCAGLPLAVRVAATRAASRPHLDLADIAADIADDQQRGHQDTFGGVGDRAGTVRSVFAWSYERLPAAEARVFRLIGLHPGAEFGVHAVAALAGLDLRRVYRCVEALADLHLVEPAGRKRYRMHDLLHAYAAHRTESDEPSQDRELAQGRMIAWYARTAQKADRITFPSLSGAGLDEVAPVGAEVSFADRREAETWLHRERVNLIAAAHSAAATERDELAMTLAVSCRFLTIRRTAWAALHLDVTDVGLAAAARAGTRKAEGMLLGLKAATLRRMDRLDEAEAAVVRTLTLAEQLQDPDGQVAGLSGLGRIRRDQGRLQEAREFYQRSTMLAREAGLLRLEAVGLCNLSWICVRLGECEQALEHAERGLVLRRQAGDLIGEAGALCDAALAWQGLGRHDTAIRLCREAVTSYHGLNYSSGDLADTLIVMADSQEHLGDLPAAVQSLQEAATVLTDLHDSRAEHTRTRISGLQARIPADPSP